MTWKAFLADLKGVKWTLWNGEEIVRVDQGTTCPWLHVAHDEADTIKTTDVFTRKGRRAITAQAIWDAADNKSGHDAQIRKDLLKACGLA